MRDTCKQGPGPSVPPTSAARAGVALLALTCLPVFGGCAGDATTTAPGSARGAFWVMTLNHRAVTLSTVAPYDTVRLVATPRDARGVALPPAARDSVVTALRPVDPTDTSLVLGPNGLIRAHAPVTGARVVVTARLGAVVRTDTVTVHVTAEPHPPRLARLVLAVLPTDTVSMAEPGLVLRPEGFVQPVVSASAVDTAGQVLTPVTVAFWSADTTLARVDPATGLVSVPWKPFRWGRVMLYASTTAYGVTRTDSIPVAVTPPVIGYITILPPSGSPTPVRHFLPALDTVVAGAVVLWAYSFDANSPSASTDDNSPVDVVFDNPAAAQELRARPDGSPVNFLRWCDPGGRGNIPAFAWDPTKPCSNLRRIRVFPTPGTYNYHSRRYGTGGTIVVVP